MRPALNFAQPSPTKSLAERSVASGFISFLPSNGSRMKVEKPASLLISACSTCWFRSPRVMSLSAGLSAFLRTRE